MAGTAESDAQRRAAVARWGARRPIRLARELELRMAELPDAEKIRLLHAIATRSIDQTPSGDAA